MESVLANASWQRGEKGTAWSPEPRNRRFPNFVQDTNTMATVFDRGSKLPARYNSLPAVAPFQNRISPRGFSTALHGTSNPSP